MKNHIDKSAIPFKKAAKDYVESQRLSEKQLDRFEQMLLAPISGHLDIKIDDLSQLEAEKLRPEKEQPKRVATDNGRFATHRFVAIVASLILLVLGSLPFTRQQQDMSWLIADEVAKNHINMKPLEIESQELGSLRQYFTQLDFTLVRSNLFAKQDYVMLGGRYCSIQGLTAAQLRFDGSDGNKITLYQVQYDPELYGELPNIEMGEQPLDIIVRGVNVSIWVEKGLLMAQAKAVD